MNEKYNFYGKMENAIIGANIKTDTFIMSNHSTQPQKDTDKNLLSDLVEKAKRLTERKKINKLEDLHNDEFKHFLIDRGYQVADQTRSGFSGSNAGEIDIMIRNEKGSPVSILEAFRLSSCGPENTVISEHIDKLLNKYDMAGLLQNFIIVYSEAVKFSELWEKYKSYILNLKKNTEFQSKCPLKEFKDTELSVSQVTDVKVGKAVHLRQGIEITVFHIFINMAV